MSKGLNRVMVIGNAGGDAELRYSGAGNPIANVSIATTERWKDRDGNVQERTEWHRVKFFGKLAEIAGEYIKKGQQVYIEGSLRTDKYVDREGVEKYSTDIIASQMQLLGGPRERAGDGGSRPASQGAQRDNGNGGNQGRGGGGSGRGPGGPGSNRGDYNGRGQSRHEEAPMDEVDDIPFLTDRGHW